MRVEVLAWKLWTGRSVSSSSLNSGDGGSSGTVEPSDMNDKAVMLCEGKRACLLCVIGDDSGRPRLFFHETCRFVGTLLRLPVSVPVDGILCRSSGLILLFA